MNINKIFFIDVGNNKEIALYCPNLLECPEYEDIIPDEVKDSENPPDTKV